MLNISTDHYILIILLMEDMKQKNLFCLPIQNIISVIQYVYQNEIKNKIGSYTSKNGGSGYTKSVYFNDNIYSYVGKIINSRRLFRHIKFNDLYSLNVVKVYE